MSKQLLNLIIIVLEFGASYLLITLAISRGNPLYYLAGFISFGSAINRIIVTLIHRNGKSRTI